MDIDSLLKNFNYSNIAFLFIAYIIISGGYVTQVLPCAMRRLLSSNIYLKHIIGLVLIFVLIMMEGGWSFNKAEQDKAPVDWSRGNTTDTLIISTVLYLVFLASAKMHATTNIIFYSILFLIYVINTKRLYLLDRNYITKENNETTLMIEKYLLGLSLIILLFGVNNYYGHKKKEYGSKFNFHRFLFGNIKCSRITSITGI